MIAVLLACAPDPLEPNPIDPTHDFDRDGFDEDAGDCDDREPAAFPGGPEACGDGVDGDCDGGDVACDRDGDGYTEGRCDEPLPDPMRDCDDTDATIHPGADEICGDAVDEDCDCDVSPCALGGLVTPDPAGSVAVDSARLAAVGEQDTSAGADVFAASDGGAVVVGWQGGPSTFAALDALAPPGPVTFGAVAGVGDLCGGTGSDLALGVPDWIPPGATDAGAVVVFDGPLDVSAFSLEGAACRIDGASGLGSAIALVGSVDDDNQGDLLVAARANDGFGIAVLVYGPLQGDGRTVHVDENPVLTRSVGSFVAAGGVAAVFTGGADLTGDGLDEMVLTSEVGDPQAWVIAGDDQRHGDLTLAEGVAALTIDVEGEVDGERPTVLAVPDLDGDEVDDLVVGVPIRDVVAIVRGRSSFLSIDPLAVPDGADARLLGEDGDRLGAALSAMGDVQGDDARDVVAGAPGAGLAFLFDAPTDGVRDLRQTAFGTIVGHDGSGLGRAVLGPGDLDGDGEVDLVVGGDSQVWFLLGGPVLTPQ